MPVKWSVDLGIAVALTVLVWTGFYLTFPSEALTLTETVFVLVVLYGLTKLVRLAWKRWGPASKSDSL